MASRLLIKEPPLQVLPSLAIKIGLNEAIILQQVHYWLNPKHNKNFRDGRYWVRNTYSQWNKQFPFWGEKTIRRTISNLEDKNILISELKRTQFKKTKFYTIDYDQLNQLCLDNKFHQTSPIVSETSENLGSHRSGHCDQLRLPKRADIENTGVELDLDPKNGIKLDDFFC